MGERRSSKVKGLADERGFIEWHNEAERGTGWMMSIHSLLVQTRAHLELKSIVLVSYTVSNVLHE